MIVRTAQVLCPLDENDSKYDHSIKAVNHGKISNKPRSGFVLQKALYTNLLHTPWPVI